jgi:hypothetical protein
MAIAMIMGMGRGRRGSIVGKCRSGISSTDGRPIIVVGTIGRSRSSKVARRRWKLRNGRFRLYLFLNRMGRGKTKPQPDLGFRLSQAFCPRLRRRLERRRHRSRSRSCNWEGRQAVAGKWTGVGWVVSIVKAEQGEGIDIRRRARARTVFVRS